MGSARSRTIRQREHGHPCGRTPSNSTVTVDAYEFHLRNHIAPASGAFGLAALRPTMVQQWINDLQVESDRSSQKRYGDPAQGR
jgi:Phage integrase, N-terminal SAM-like domain